MQSKIVITVSGGLIQGVIANGKDIEVIVLDYDNPVINGTAFPIDQYMNDQQIESYIVAEMDKHNKYLDIEILCNDPSSEEKSYSIYHIEEGQRKQIIKAFAMHIDFDFLSSDDLELANQKDGGFFKILVEDAKEYFSYYYTPEKK